MPAVCLALAAPTAPVSGRAQHQSGRPAPPGPVVCGEVATVGRPGETPDRATVYELQLGLRLLSLFDHPIDGLYDPFTRQSVAAFQRQAGLPPDGVAGPKTWQALARAFEERAAALVASQKQAARSAPEPEYLPRHPDVRPGGYWIVVDTNHLQLTLYRDGQVMGRWPVAVGKAETITPVGEWRIIQKSRDWGGGFGSRWMGLDVPWGIYGIHGTNKPWSIGTRASAGCIRMFDSDVQKLWDIVPGGTPVTVVGVLPEGHWDEPIEAGVNGWNVPVLQWALRDAGFDPGRADGRMGPSTMRAIREAQQVLGLTPTDAATPDLFRALELRR